jgi:hypothetical protein
MTDIAELFARDPEHLTKSDIAEIITKYREARAQFALDDQQAGNAKKVKAKKANLDTLDFDF